MKHKDTLENYYFYSGKTSDIIRQLALAGIAVIWLFKLGPDNAPKLPSELISPLIFIVCCLLCDLAQYTLGTIIWGIYSRCTEKKLQGRDIKFTAPPYINWPTIFFFYTKIILAGFAYWHIVIFLKSKLF